MLSDRQIALMRTQQQEAMPLLIDIERWVYESDGIGGTRRTPTRSVIASAVESRWRAGEFEGQFGQASRELEIEHWTVRIPIGTEVADEDILVIPEDDTEYRIERVREPKSYDTVITLNVRAVT